MYNLEKFVSAQSRSYETALEEIRNGRKESHWIWYIFPQIEGLGMSYTSQMYAISCLDEAREYLNHPVLGPRLIEISKALLDLPTSNPSAVMGWPDDLKLRSSMTLFSMVAEDETVFDEVLEKFYKGEKDDMTIRLAR